MRIKYAIMGSTTQDLYYDFWPIVSKVWKEVFNITPVLGLICEEETSDFIEKDYGIVKKVKSIEGISDALLSQIIRFYLPTTLDGVCITSDIDMMPLSKKYFIDYVEMFDESKFYVMTADNPECLANKEYQMCYNVGTPKSFSEVLSIDSSWTDFANKLNDLGNGWVTDQRYLYDAINSHKDKSKIVLLRRGFEGPLGYASNRIDRGFWKYDPIQVTSGNYIDSHLLRPYKQHKQKIDALINLLY